MRITMGVGKKLGIAFCVLFVLIAILSSVVLIGFNSLTGNFVQIVDHRAVEQRLISGIESRILDLRAQQRGIGVQAYARDYASMEKSKAAWNKASSELNEVLASLLELLKNDERKARVLEAKESTAKVFSYFPEIVKLYEAGKMDEAQQMGVQRSTPEWNRLLAITRQLSEQNKKMLEEDKRNAIGRSQASSWTAGIVIVLTLGMGVCIGWLIRRICGTLNRLAAQMAHGSSEVANAAAQVSASSQSLAQGASEQATSLEQTSSSTEEITSMTRKNADNSRDSAELMSLMSEEVAKGNRKLEEMVASMSEISRSSEKIAHIIKTIDEIAFQTNILALNAAVEAARAGEAGMGFAVVADEVRNLAQRCTQAAKDTAALIEDSIAKSADGGRKLNEVTTAIAGITDKAEKAKVMADEVHVGSQEQSRGLDQISKAIAQMEQVTQKTAASAEQSAAAGEELNAQSQTLQQLIGELTDFVGARS